MNETTYKTKYSKSRVVDGHRVSAQVGIFLVPDGHRLGNYLLECDVQEPVGEGWPGADFYFHSHNVDVDLACNVQITGRTIQWDCGPRVRVKIEWVGDCEPSSFSGGWLFLDSRNKEKVS